MLENQGAYERFPYRVWPVSLGADFVGRRIAQVEIAVPDWRARLRTTIKPDTYSDPVLPPAVEPLGLGLRIEGLSGVVFHTIFQEPYYGCSGGWYLMEGGVGVSYA